MKIFSKILVCLFTFIGVMQAGFAQTGVLNANDTIRIYNPQAPPATPPYGTLAKWVKTTRLSFNSTSFKCYFYKGIAFRLKFPKSYQQGVNDGKLYPLYLFWHGVGEKGTIYDNEYQLYHGGSTHMNAVDAGKFDGFLLYPQSSTSDGFFGDAQYDVIYDLIVNYLIPQVKVDPSRVMVDGLSGGGQAVWQFSEKYPKLIGAMHPISAASPSFISGVSTLKYTPIWQSQGGLDVNPNPNTTIQIVNAFLNAGGNIKYKVYTTLGHGCWDSAWAEPDYFPFYNRAHKANPWPLNGRYQFCANDTIIDTLGLMPGFDSYEWSFNGGPAIPGANSNTYVAKAIGSYSARYKNGSVWSAWSPAPAVISIKGATISPNITVSGLASIVLPAPDGSTGVQLEVPDGYASYLWQQVGSNTTLSTTRILPNATPGNYQVKVTEKFGCSSDFSPAFTVINANSTGSPDIPINLSATSISKTQISLHWSENPSPAYMETQFEVYQGTAANGPYKLIGFSPAHVDSFWVNGLNAKTTYYYRVRAINNLAGSAATPAANATTQTDNTAPTAPGNLKSGLITNSSVQLMWDSAVDDTQVTGYDIYVNGQKSYSVPGTQTSFIVYSLTDGKTYTFAVKAKDFSNNISPFSNQVAVIPAYNGLNYSYYEGVYNVLPDFNTLTPLETGNTTNVSLAPRNSETNFAFKWTGIVNIPVTGTYTFRTTSDDGSKLYIDSDYSFTTVATVNNDGLHGSTTKTSNAMTLTKGPHKFTATFLQQGGGYAMSVLWKTPQTGSSFVAIPDSAFVEKVTAAGTPPNAPSGLTATALSYKSVGLNWVDNSNNEIAFEIYRSTTATGSFAVVGRTLAQVNSFVDSSSVQASTTYFYKVKAINQYGSSKYNGEDSNALRYNYYETGSLNNLPNFSTLTPTSTGTTSVFDLSMPNRGTNFAVSYDGFINIPTTGNYTFYTSSDDGSKLYINGTTEANLVVNNDGLHGTTEKSGTVNNLSAGAHIIRGTYFQNGGGQVFTVSIAGPGLSKQQIPASMLGKPPTSVTTQAMPGAPSTPANFAAQAQSPSKVALSWTDGGANAAVSYDIFRSNDGVSYALLKSVPAAVGTNAYTDSSLFANASYYYEVRAVNLGGISPFTTAANVTTLDNAPVATPIPNKNVRYSTELQVNFVSTDVDNEQLTTVVSNLPAFATFLSTGNGTATLTFDPQQADSGFYQNITVTVTDQHGGSASSSFNLTVNDNYNPVISGSSTALTINEGAVDSSLVLNGNDQNPSDSITWTYTGLPSFVTPIVNGAGAANSVTFNVHPTFADQGTYTITANTSDGRGGTDSKQITITVNQVNPSNKIYLNFKDVASVNALSPWNNISASPTINAVFGPFTDDSGAPTTIGFKILTNWQNIATASGSAGVKTGNNSGVYPDAVISTFWWTNATKQTIKFSGLDTSSLVSYRLTFFGSRTGVTDVRNAQYTAGGVSVKLNGSGNSTNTVSIPNLRPAADSTLNVDIQAAAGSVYAYLGSIVIERVYDDKTVPATPNNLTASMTPKNFVSLTWNPAAYNDSGYQVYRSTGPDTSIYTLIGTTAPKASSFVDSLVIGGITYNYKVRAFNSYGNSNYSAVVTIAAPNKAPVLAAIADQRVKGDASITVPLQATFDAGNSVTFIGTSLPPFATITDNGNGTGSLTIAPTNAQLGVFTATITAQDNHNLTAVVSFKITVTNKNITSTFVNFNQLDPATAPWNNFNKLPAAGASIANLLDESGSPTGMTIALNETWSGANEVGAVTGNNSGVYPDQVMMTAYYESTANTKTVNLTGLNPSLQYNLVFFGSRIAGDTRITKFSAGGQTVQLNASNNTSQTVQINGLSPDATGKLSFTVAKDATSSFAYLNALVIQSFTPSNVPIAPSNLTAAGMSRTSAVLNWNDRSGNETAFEIWRAPVNPGTTDFTGALTLIDTVAANVTTYTDKGLAPSSNYAYQVRARAATITSDYSNIAYAATVAYAVYINYNRDTPAGTPWNNTNGVPNPDAVYPSLRDDNNNPTAMNMTIIDNFSGDNQFGDVTGNNSGIYPDNVIVGSWWVDAGITAKVKIDGLNQAMMYNFVFFGSRNGSSPTDPTDRTTIFAIGANSVSLNCTNNNTKTVQINGVVPDSSGAIYFTVTKGASAPFGYLNALVIQATNSFNAPVVITSRSAASTTRQTTADSLAALNRVIIYPNPITSDVKLRFDLTSQVSKLNVAVRDISGRTLFIKQLNNLPQGTSIQELGLSPDSIRSGVYFVEISGMPGGLTKVLRVVKP